MIVKNRVERCSGALNRGSDPRSAMGFLEPETDMLIRNEARQVIGCKISNSPTRASRLAPMSVKLLGDGGVLSFIYPFVG